MWTRLPCRNQPWPWSRYTVLDLGHETYHQVLSAESVVDLVFDKYRRSVEYVENSESSLASPA